jgi:molybdopterin-guanine dinucleotide biosynthesis protein A
MRPAGLVLAGGEGRRMGGADKGLLNYAGRALVEQVLERLRPQVGELFISANRHLDRYAAFGCRVLSDAEPGFLGPLAGLLAGLRAMPPDGWLQAAPCDAPHLPLDLVARLQAGRGNALAALPVAAGRAQPTFCLVHASTADSLAAYLARGERRMLGWLQAQQAASVDFDDVAAFANFNTPADLDGL